MVILYRQVKICQAANQSLHAGQQVKLFVHLTPEGCQIDGYRSNHYFPKRNKRYGREVQLENGDRTLLPLVNLEVLE